MVNNTVTQKEQIATDAPQKAKHHLQSLIENGNISLDNLWTWSDKIFIIPIGDFTVIEFVRYLLRETYASSQSASFWALPRVVLSKSITFTRWSFA